MVVKKRSPTGSSSEKNSDHKASWLIACDANMSPEDFEKTPLISKRANVCDSTRRSVDVQIKKRQRRMGRKVYMTVSQPAAANKEKVQT